jgi:hypothetical protein
MPFEPVEAPIPSPEAFRREGDAATLSTAAALLYLGYRLRGDEQALSARRRDAFGERGDVTTLAFPEDDVEAALGIPPIRASWERIHPTEARKRLADAGLRPEDTQRPDRDVIADVAERFHEGPTPPRAAELFEASLAHPAELVRVAAASSYLALTSDPGRPLEVLRTALRNEDRLTQEVAATSLARFAPEDESLARLLVEGQTPEGGAPSTTCIIVHGTWARNSEWWQPGGDFHDYFKAKVCPDVYSAPDRFFWSGGYSPAARAQGAVDLRNWVAAHKLNGLDVFTHSHGGSVAMLATHGPLALRELVLLSCPVDVTKYLPRFAGIGKIVSIQVHLDLVILADGSGTRFDLPGIREHVLPIWFDHFKTHDPDVWRRHNVSRWL